MPKVVQSCRIAGLPDCRIAGLPGRFSSVAIDNDKSRSCLLNQLENNNSWFLV